MPIESANGSAGSLLYSALSESGALEALAVLSDASSALPLRSADSRDVSIIQPF
jgi:hypothetical protein